MARCFMIGHRELCRVPQLADCVERLIVQEGVSEFYVGHYGGFDQLVAGAVKQAKRKHAHVRLFLVLPYHPAERPMEIPEGFDGTFYPDGMEKVPHRLAIVQANRRMVDRVDHLIAAVRHPASNAQRILEYARRRGKQTVNLFDEWEEKSLEE